MGRTDYPFYDGRPVRIEASGWALILAACALAFVALVALPFETFPLNLLPAVLFVALPLMALSRVSGGHQAALFGPFRLKEFGIALGFGLLAIVASIAIGLALRQVTDMTTNPAAGLLVAGGPADYAAFFARTAIQLVGEELVTILPLLAVLWFCVDRLGMSRRTGLIAGVVVSTLWFAALHLPTYDWNLIQCFAGIGGVRLILTAAYLLTRNLWVSAGAHIINDWTEFLLPAAINALAHGPIDPTA